MKTKVHGVRFSAELLEHLKEKYNIKTGQQAVNFLEGFYLKGSAKFEQPRPKEMFVATPSKVLAMTPTGLSSDLPEPVAAQIAAIKSEQCPAHRNTSLGRKVWQKEQEARVQELLELLKTLT